MHVRYYRVPESQRTGVGICTALTLPLAQRVPALLPWRAGPKGSCHRYRFISLGEGKGHGGGRHWGGQSGGTSSSRRQRGRGGEGAPVPTSVTPRSSVLRRASHACGSVDSVLPVIQSGQSRRNHVESVTESQ